MNKSTLDTKKSSFIQRQDGNFGLWCNLGDDYIKLNDIKSAIECYEKALEFDSHIIEIYLNIGVAYNKIGEERRAIEYFQKAVEMQPQYGNGWYNLGYSYGSLDDTSKSLCCYEKAIECSIPPTSGAFCTMGYEFLKQNDLNKAYRSLILGMIEISSQKKNELMGMLLLNLGHVYYLKGNIASAKEKYHNSMNCYVNEPLFIENAKADIPDLLKIGLDLNAWQDLINNIKDIKKLNIETFVNKVISFVQYNILEIEFYQEENNERLIFYIDKESPLIGWRFKDAYNIYINGGEEWEVIAFKLFRELNKLVSLEENLIFIPASDDTGTRGNKKTEGLFLLPNNDSHIAENMSAKKWWKFWE